MCLHMQSHHKICILYFSPENSDFSGALLPFVLWSLVSSSLDISSALWLKTYGLVARRLTIMDALAPTAVPHGTKYIPVLDKHVLSKVFDEVKLLCCFKAKINPATAFKRIFFFFSFTHFHTFHNCIVQCSWQMAEVH